MLSKRSKIAIKQRKMNNMSVPDNNHRQNDSKTLSKAESMNKKTNAKVLIPYYICLPSGRQTQS